MVQVWAATETSIGKIRTMIDNDVASKQETLLAEQDVSGDFDFMDGDSHQILVEYTGEELTVYFVADKPVPVLKTALKLNDYVKLDNGTAYLGFAQETAGVANETYIENWTFSSDSSRQGTQGADPWNGLSLEYRSHWPLHLMFSPDVIDKYNALFRFLLPVKRVQLDLQYVWAMKVRVLKRNNSAHFRKMMLLRQHMSFLIDNIFAYLQVDVLESQWSRLVKAISESSDFEEVRMLHDKYLDSITEQCFLNLSQVLKALQDVLQMCEGLCRLIKQIEEDNCDEEFWEEFDKIKNNFEKQSNMVFKLLSNFKHYH